MSTINEVHSKPRLYVSVNLFWSMAAMLRDSVATIVIVVVRTRPRAIPLAMITMRKSTHEFPFLSHDKYGAPLRTTTDYLFQSTLYLISALCGTLLPLFLHLGSLSSHGCLGAPAILTWRGGSRSHQDTQGWRLSLALLPFPSQISFDELNSAVMSTDFSIFLHTFRNCLAI